MKYQSLMHVSFFTDHLEEMVDFYTRQMGGKIKSVVRYGIYVDRDDRPEMQAIAKVDPERIFYLYIELAPLQFIELFPAKEGQKPHTDWNEYLGYSHFALVVEDIFAAKKELEERGVHFLTEISKGPSETWQVWTSDPDGNRFELMQYTEKSLQIVGNVD